MPNVNFRIRNIHRTTVLLLLLMLVASSSAIGLKRAPAYKSGETLKCNLYFNWKFIWVKAGNASLVIRDTVYNGEKAQRMTLYNSTNKHADKFFRMRDTLTTVFTTDSRPLYYRKASAEGKRYYLNEVRYDYLDNGKVKVSQSYKRDDEPTVYKEDIVDAAVYDMMSLLAYARTLDFSSLKTGDRLTYPVATGRRIEQQHLIYRGKARTKADDGYEYDCMLISLVKMKDGKERSVIDFYVTDDFNHLPIMLDLALNFGSAKARITEKQGLLYPLKPARRH